MGCNPSQSEVGNPAGATQTVDEAEKDPKVESEPALTVPAGATQTVVEAEKDPKVESEPALTVGSKPALSDEGKEERSEEYQKLSMRFDQLSRAVGNRLTPAELTDATKDEKTLQKEIEVLEKDHQANEKKNEEEQLIMETELKRALDSILSVKGAMTDVENQQKAYWEGEIDTFRKIIAARPEGFDVSSLQIKLEEAQDNSRKFTKFQRVRLPESKLAGLVDVTIHAGEQPDAYEGSLWQYMYNPPILPKQFREVQDIIFTICEHYFLAQNTGILRDEEQATAEAEAMVEGIFWDLYDDYTERKENERFLNSKRLPVAAKRHGHLLELARAWTLPTTDTIFGREWCGMLQCAITSKDPAVVYAAAQVWRGTNLFLISEREIGPVQISAVPDQTFVVDTSQDRIAQAQRSKANLERVKAGEDLVATVAKKMPRGKHLKLAEEVLWRGGRIPEEHLHWFDRSIGQYARSARAVATSPNPNTAFRFMVKHGHPKEDDRYHLVLFKLRMTKKCDHVSALDFLSAVEEEVEWLFTPFSAFRVVDVQRDVVFDQQQQEVLEECIGSLVSCAARSMNQQVSGLRQYQLIELEVAPDNRTVKDGGPLQEGLLIMPWI